MNYPFYQTLIVAALVVSRTAAAWTNNFPTPFSGTMTSRAAVRKMTSQNFNVDAKEQNEGDERILPSSLTRKNDDGGDDIARIQAMEEKLDGFLEQMDPQKLEEKMEALLEHPEEFSGLMDDAESFETKLVDELLCDSEALQEHLLESSETPIKSSGTSECEDFAKFLVQEEAPKETFSTTATTSTITMPKVNMSKESVEQAFHTIETGMVAVAKTLRDVVKESKEAIVHLNSTTIGSTDTTYEQALGKVAKGAKGLFLVLGTVAKDSTNFVMEEAKHFKAQPDMKEPKRKVPFFLEQDEGDAL